MERVILGVMMNNEEAFIVATRALDSANSAHKRIDQDQLEIDSLRTSRHKHNGMIHNHQGILSGIEKSITLLIATAKEANNATKANTEALVQFKYIALTIASMGVGLISFSVFVGGKIIKLW